MFSGSIPKAATLSAWVDTATKWRRTASSSPSCPTSQSRALLAFVSVSIVENVFEETMNKVSAGSRSRVASAMSAPSTFDTNRNVIERSEKSRNASVPIAGPRSDPPIPMFTTARILAPVDPVHAPERTRSANAPIFRRTAWTPGTTFTPSTSMTESAGARRAT